MIFEKGQRVLFIGDSITDCGRAHSAAPFGDGYVSLVRAFVAARYPAYGLTWINRGVAGDTVRDLRARWRSDVLDERPDWLSVMIGINDVWRAFDGNRAAAVPIGEFESTLRELLAEAVADIGCRLLLATPYLIEPDRSEPQRAESDRYAGVVRRVARDLSAILVDVQEAFDEVLRDTDPGAWAGDRIHPNLAGHAVIAQRFLDAVDWRPSGA